MEPANKGASGYKVPARRQVEMRALPDRRGGGRTFFCGDSKAWCTLYEACIAGRTESMVGTNVTEVVRQMSVLTKGNLKLEEKEG